MQGLKKTDPLHPTIDEMLIELFIYKYVLQYSSQEISKTLNIDKRTLSKYLEILNYNLKLYSAVYCISNNLRKIDLTKTQNILIEDFKKIYKFELSTLRDPALTITHNDLINLFKTSGLIDFLKTDKSYYTRNYNYEIDLNQLRTIQYLLYEVVAYADVKNHDNVEYSMLKFLNIMIDNNITFFNDFKDFDLNKTKRYLQYLYKIHDTSTLYNYHFVERKKRNVANNDSSRRQVKVTLTIRKFIFARKKLTRKISVRKKRR